jgi:hypothetical protein
MMAAGIRAHRVEASKVLDQATDPAVRVKALGAMRDAATDLRQLYGLDAASEYEVTGRSAGRGHRRRRRRRRRGARVETSNRGGPPPAARAGTGRAGAVAGRGEGRQRPPVA